MGINPPSSVNLKVVETEPSLKGATAASQNKPATMETGLVVQVPPFIEIGELIAVDTSDGKYLGRAKE
jgi:elongation factor P